MPKMTFIQNLVKDSVVYGITKYLSVIAAIFLTPIYTRIIPRYEYGVMDIFNTWINFSILFIPLGLMEAMPRLWAEARKDNDLFRKMVGNQNSVLLLMALLFLLVSAGGMSFYESEILNSSSYHSVFYLSVALVFAQVVNNQQLTFFRLELKRYHYLTLSVLQFIILSSLGFVLVYYFKLSIKGFFLAALAAALSSAGVGLILNRPLLILRFNLPLVREMLGYSLPLLYVVMFFSISDIVDRYILNKFLNTETVGLYSVAVRVASIPLFFTSAFATAWFPRIFALDDLEEQKSAISKSYSAAVAFFGLILVLVIAFRKELIYFFAPDYQDAGITLVLLAVSNTVNGLGPLYAFGIHLKKKSFDFLKAASISIPVNILLSLLLVSKFGAAGVAFGTLIGAIIWTFFRYYYGQKRLKCDLSHGPLLITTIAVFTAFALSFFLSLNPVNFILKILFSAYPLYLVLKFLLKSYRELD